MINSTRYVYIRYMYDTFIGDTGNIYVKTQIEDIMQSIVLYVDKLDTDIEIGSAEFYGLTQADLVNWYMKPHQITMGGTSIISSNPFVSSDNIITTINTKLKTYLSENNYNYYQKPRFLIYIQNDLNGFNTYEAIIKGFNFDRDVNVPDAYKWNMTFKGKPYVETVTKNAQDSVAKTDRTEVLNSENNMQSESARVNAEKFVPTKGPVGRV